MKSRPNKSPWGIHKTRVRLQGIRLNRAIDRTRVGKKSVMSMRFFNFVMSSLEQWRRIDRKTRSLVKY